MFFPESQSETEIPAGVRGRQPGRLTHGHRLGTEGDGSWLARDASRPLAERRSRDHRPSAEPAKRTRASRDTFLGAAALVILAGVICCVSWDSPSESRPAAETAPVPLAVRSSLTTAQQEFVDQVVARYDFAEAQRGRALKIGNDVCGMLSTGSTVGYIASTINGTDSALSPGDANSLVNLAAQDLCPGIIPVPSPAVP